ncbi:ANKRD50 [Cordylochernes scorpioides]|uniref:ANKRD50 n=1 Tax=Cordylochernes scorpioides TaxID=51811 RepID=A0ABY6JWI7_9ARAC|nr:ANKRD50 [Cordylochernes scorpioides]
MAQCLLQDKTFYGREWAFSKIAHAVENHSRPCGGLLVTGGPGCGKTALSCELVWPSSKLGRQYGLRRRVVAFHFCQAQDIASLSLTAFINGLVTQLSITPLINGYVERLAPDIENILSQANCEANPDEVFKKAILDPLLEIEAPNQPCIILVDSIDESYLQVSSNKGEETSRNIAELLGNHHAKFPPWLILLCSCRKQSKSVMRMFTGFKKIALDDLRKAHVVRDVQQYILCRLDREEQLRQHLNRETAEMLNQLHIKSNGCFIYLEKVLDGVAENFILLREVREIPGTLNGLYLWMCQRLFGKKQFQKVLPILNVILVARRPLTEEQLHYCVRTRNTNLGYEEFRKRLGLLSKVIVEGSNRTKLLFHHSFAEWLLDVKHCTQRYLCDAAEGHAMMAMYYSCRAPQLNAEEVLDFALHLSKVRVVDPPMLPLWLALSGAPSPRETSSDPRVRRLLEAAGARAAAPEPPDPGPPRRRQPQGRQQENTAAHRGLRRQLRPRRPNIDIAYCDLESVSNQQCAAARQGHARVVERLLQAGADPDPADGEGWTPLRSAAWAGHAEVVDVLLRHGASVDRADHEGRTALRAASWGGHEDIVNRLLDEKAAVDAEDREGRTALIAAAYMGHRDIVSLLLERGASPDHADRDGRTALSVAAPCAGHAPVVALLLDRGASVDPKDVDGATPLLVAALEGRAEACELLLEAGADVDHCDKAGRTPLLAAASMGRPEVVSKLLFWGAAIDSIDGEGRTVLCIAAAQGNAETVRLLLDRGLDETHRDNAGWTALHYGAYEGHEEACSALLEAAARASEVDNDGRTALHLAAQEGHMAVVELLVEHDPGVLDIRAHDGRTAVRLAALEGHGDTVSVLADRGANLDAADLDGRTALYLLAMEDRHEMASRLLGRGADVEARDTEGRTALHAASWQGHASMALLLLRNGAMVDATDRDQRTALQAAAWQGRAAVVRMLLEHGARADHACNQGATALAIAAQEGHLEAVRVLLEHGADPVLADQFGRSPLRVAARGGHTEVVQLLEDFLNQLSQLSRQDSTASLTSGASTAETKPCSAVLCQPDYESPDSTVDKRKSFFSTHSSSNQSAERPPLTFTQQLQQCTRKRNRRILSPPVEENSPPSDTKLSPTQLLIRQPALGQTEAHRRAVGIPPLPQDPRPKRNGIVTNPNFKPSNHHNYEVLNPSSLKKETPL